MNCAISVKVRNKPIRILVIRAQSRKRPNSSVNCSWLMNDQD